MWFFIFGFMVLGWLILKNEKNFNKSIQALEERIDSLEKHARVLEMNNEDCEKMINTLSQRVKELEEELNI